MQYWIVDGHTKKTQNLSKLETIQNMALQLAFGLQPHSSSNCTKKLAGGIPISEKQPKPLLNILSRFKLTGSSTLFSIFVMGALGSRIKSGLHRGKIFQDSVRTGHWIKFSLILFSSFLHGSFSPTKYQPKVYTRQREEYPTSAIYG